MLTTPVVRCLKQQLNAEVHYLTKKAYASMLLHNPHIDKVHTLSDQGLLKTISRLKRENFDLIIDLHHNLRTFMVKTLLRKKAYSFNKLNYQKWLLVNFKIDKLPDEHIVDRYMATCEPLGVHNDGEGLDYYIQPKDEVDISILPEQFQKGYIVWVLGAKQGTKQYPSEKIVKALGTIDEPIVLIGGKEERRMVRTIMSLIHNKPNVYDAVGEYNISQSASLVRQSYMVITNDTGMMHIAAAFKKKTISLWGNTVPAFGMYPYYGDHLVSARILEVQDLKCRPCSKIGYDSCPKGHFNCMNEIHTAEIKKAITELEAST